MSKIRVVKFVETWLNPFYMVAVEPNGQGSDIHTVLANVKIEVPDMSPDQVVRRVLRKLAGLPL